EFQSRFGHNMLLALATALFRPRRASEISIEGKRLDWFAILKNLVAALFPLVMAAVTAGGIWWYVVIHQASEAQALQPTVTSVQRATPAPLSEEKPQELGAAAVPED